MNSDDTADIVHIINYIFKKLIKGSFRADIQLHLSASFALIATDWSTYTNGTRLSPAHTCISQIL